jgi:hypothetical protein
MAEEEHSGIVESTRQGEKKYGGHWGEGIQAEGALLKGVQAEGIQGGAGKAED